MGGIRICSLDELLALKAEADRRCLIGCYRAIVRELARRANLRRAA